MILSVVQSTSVAMNCSYGLAMASTMSSAKIRPRIQLKKNSLFSVLFIKCSDNNGKGGGAIHDVSIFICQLKKSVCCEKKVGRQPIPHSHTPDGTCQCSVHTICSEVFSGFQFGLVHWSTSKNYAWDILWREVLLYHSRNGWDHSLNELFHWHGRGSTEYFDICFAITTY